MRIFGVVALTAALAVPAVAQQQGQPQYQQPQDRQVGTSGSTVTVEAIADNPERYYDQTVNVSGEVGNVYGKKAFNIKEEGIIDIDDRLLVLSKNPVNNLREDAVVQVSGKVKQFVKSDIERELGISNWDDWGLDQDFFSDRDRKPVLIAESVQVRTSGDRDRESARSDERQGMQDERRRAQSGTAVGTSGAAGAATVEAIADNPERFYDQTVSLSAEVGDVHSKQAFNLQEEGILDVDDRLLVLSKKPVANLSEDSMVHVRGKVKRFVKSDIERDLGISDWVAYGLDENFFSDNDGKPVLIAESVEVRPARERK